MARAQLLDERFRLNVPPRDSQRGHRVALRVVLRVGLRADPEQEGGLLGEFVVVEAGDGDVLASIPIDHDEALAEFDAVVFRAVAVDYGLADLLRRVAVDKLGGRAHGLVGAVVEAQAGRTHPHLDGGFILVSCDDGLFGEKIGPGHLRVVGNLVGFLARHGALDYRVGAVEHRAHRRVEGGREHGGKHQRPGKERGAEHNREDGQGEPELVGCDVAQRHFGHRAHTLSLNPGHDLQDGVHGGVGELVDNRAVA